MGEVGCPSCGATNPERAKFCLECGTALAATAAQPPREVRKTVTVLFADITGSTALGEGRDPEAVRTLLARYFAAMRSAIERHGGTVEKFIGDAVMAVFGIPVAHEDDALRAVRAARDMARALAALNEELGAAIRIRTGINTGEVVSGTGGPGGTLVTGDTVNVAARLEQAAEPGDVLLGEATVQLTRGSVDVDPAVGLELRGKSEPVIAHRLRDLVTGMEAAARHADTSMVGRDRELATLREAFERVVGSRQPELAVVVGMAGVGKSRLLREFIATLSGRVMVLRGRCLPYGQGITFWPIGEIVRGAVGIEEADTAEAARARLHARLEGMPDATHVGAALERLLGLGPGSSPVEELSWATRRLLEELAAGNPLGVVIEDVHWAEPALLDLVDHVVTAGRGPILLVTPSRPEIAETRPAFLAGPLTLEIVLEPLGDEAVSELIDQLLSGAGEIAALRARIAAVADGNPLYVEELIGMLVDDGTVRQADDGTWIVEGALDRIAMPATIGALLTARLDQLGPERTVAERGSVIGRVFETRAVAHLSPELGDHVLGERLDVLVGRDLVRPEASSIADEMAYRFRHILIRDAAYESLAKLERARLHESLGDWLEDVAGDRLAEIEEILGYHQEQAVLYRRELGLTGDGDALARRASAHLAAAATKATDRGDNRAGAGLFDRAAGLLGSDDPARDRLLIEEAVALTRSEAADRAEAILSEIIERSTVSGDAALRSQAIVSRWHIGELVSSNQEAIRRDVREATGILEAAGDELGLARAWRLLESAHWYAGEGAEGEDAVVRALHHARRSGRRSEVNLCYEDLTAIMNTGPTPVDAGLERCHQILVEDGEDRIVEAWMSHALAHLEAKRGDFAAAREHAALTSRVLDEHGQTLAYAVNSEAVGDVEYQAGDAAAAVRVLRDGLEIVHGLGRTSAIVAAHLGHVAWHAGDIALAEETAEEGMAAGGWTRALTLGTLGRVRASQGRFDEAESFVREALDHWETTDYLTYHGWTLEALGDVLALAGRRSEAIAALEAAAELHARKGSTVGVAMVRSRLGELHSPA